MLAVGVVALAALVAVGLAARHSARREILQFIDLEDRTARGEARAALVEIAAGLGAQGASPARLRVLAGRLPAGFAALLVSADGRLLAVAPALRELSQLTTRRDGEELVVAARAAAAGAAETLELRLKGTGLPVRLAAGGAATLELLPLPAARQGRHAAAALGSLDRRLLAATAAAGALALLLAWLLARRLLAPVRELQRASSDLAGGDLARRVPAAGADELADLGRAFNRMAAQLERQERLRRDLVDDVAHELRTPLTAMRCRLEAVQDGVAADARAAVDGLHEDVLHLGRLVDDLQELALAEARQLRLAPVAVALAAAVASAVRAAGLDGDPRVAVEVAAGLAVVADPVRLRQVLVNLLSNAARHAPAAGTIRIVGRPAADTVEVEVSDSGCGLDAEQLARVFERFYRTDPARRRDDGGSGLGLAIVRSLVEAQGGRVWTASAPGAGATFGFSLPAAAVSPPV
jgi:signal transduction histidine kinase